MASAIFWTSLNPQPPSISGELDGLGPGHEGFGANLLGSLIRPVTMDDNRDVWPSRVPTSFEGGWNAEVLGLDDMRRPIHTPDI